MANTQELLVTLPGVGNTQVYHLDADTPVKFNFDLTNAVFSGENGNLDITVEGGGTIVLEGYEDLAASNHLPLFEMPNGEVVDGSAYLYAFNDTDQNTDLETAAGAATGSSGAGQYNDDPGALYDGINALDGQGDAYDPHSFETLDPVGGVDDTGGDTDTGNEAPTIDLSMATVTFVSEDAGYDNIIGTYELDADGNPINPQIIVENSNTAIPGEVLATYEDGTELHYFLISGETGGTASGTPSFVQLASGEWVISFDGGTTTYEVRFDDTSINNDPEASFQYPAEADGNLIAVDDQFWGTDDDDFNDVILRESDNSGTGFENTFTEGGDAVPIAAVVNISDADSTHMSQAVITITNAQSGDSLNIDTSALPSGITATVNGTEIILSGDATIADYETAIELITYSNGSSDPDTTDRTIEVQVWDDYADPTGAASNVATAIIHVIAVNPVLDSMVLTAATLPLADDASLIADADLGHAASVSSATGEASLATGFLLDNDYSSDDAAMTAAIVGTGVGAWGTLEITDAATGAWTYTPNSEAILDSASGLDQPTVETFTYQVTDAHGLTDTATLYVPVHVDANVTDAGTTGNDVIYGSDGNDTISGLEGNDFLYGEAGNDTIDGGAGHDYISGGAGNDVLHGGAGNDYLFGGTGNDTLWGGSGDDHIFAGSGDDNVFVSSGHDTVTLGAGADTVTIDPTYLTAGGGDATMTVTDFNIGEGDQLSLSNLTSGVIDVTSDADSGNLTLTITDVNAAGDDITITLQGVMPATHDVIDHPIDIGSGDDLNTVIQHIINSGGHDS